MLQYFLVFERVDPWPHTFEGLCWVWLATLNGLKDLDLEGRDQSNIFVLTLHYRFCFNNIDQCSAVGDLNAKDC